MPPQLLLHHAWSSVFEFDRLSHGPGLETDFKNCPIKAVTLDELRVETGILDPTMQTMLTRYGYVDEIGEDYKGQSAVPIETAARFVAAYEDEKTQDAGKWKAYQRYLREQREVARRARREQAKAKREASEARQKKDQEAARAAAAEAKAELQASADADREPTFEEWQAQNGV